MKVLIQHISGTSIIPLIYRPRSIASRQITALLTFPTRTVSTYPQTAECPPSTCQCVDTPEGLDIDRKLPLKGTVPIYSQHIIIRTGQKRWSSRIEEDNKACPGFNLAKELKALLGPKGKYHDPHRNVMISNSTLTPMCKPGHHDLVLFPQGINVAFHAQHIEAFVTDGFPSVPHPELVANSASLSFEVTPRCYPTVFICGHESRDRRCGILGPLIQGEFLRHRKDRAAAIAMAQRGVHVGTLGKLHEEHQSQDDDFSVSLISHIGGHKWAGNVIIYFPPGHQLPNGKISPLAGTGVWYGRVEPRHVEGIIRETIRQGRLIAELLRGVHD